MKYRDQPPLFNYITENATTTKKTLLYRLKSRSAIGFRSDAYRPDRKCRHLCYRIKTDGVNQYTIGSAPLAIGFDEPNAIAFVSPTDGKCD